MFLTIGQSCVQSVNNDKIENKVILLNYKLSFCFKLFIIYISSLHNLRLVKYNCFSKSLWIFPRLYMQVTMKIFGILKLWNSEQALARRKTWPFLEVHICNSCSRTGNMESLARAGCWPLYQSATIVKRFKETESGCPASSERKANSHPCTEADQEHCRVQRPTAPGERAPPQRRRPLPHAPQQCVCPQLTAGFFRATQQTMWI